MFLCDFWWQIFSHIDHEDLFGVVFCCGPSSADVGEHFARIFKDFAQIFRVFARIFIGFVQIFKDFAQLFRDFARSFDPCTPASYTTGVGATPRRAWAHNIYFKSFRPHWRNRCRLYKWNRWGQHVCKTVVCWQISTWTVVFRKTSLQRRSQPKNFGVLFLSHYIYINGISFISAQERWGHLQKNATRLWKAALQIVFPLQYYNVLPKPIETTKKRFSKR